MKRMKNLFETETVVEVITRIDRLEPASRRQWGKMEPAQMMAHCSLTMNQAMGELNLPRATIGRLLGPFFKPLVTNATTPPKNGPSAPELLVSDARDFQSEQANLKQKVQSFHERGEAGCTRHPHPFVGALTPYGWSRGMYKHLDHHLRQFGV